MPMTNEFQELLCAVPRLSAARIVSAGFIRHLNHENLDNLRDLKSKLWIAMVH